MNIQSTVRGRTLWRSFGVAGVLAAGVYMYGNTPRVMAGPAAVVESAPALVAAPQAATSYADAVQRAAPAVVTVRIERKAEVTPSAFDDDLFQRFFGRGGQGPGNGPGQRRVMPAPVERGLGSGVIVTPDGNILTNNHVVENADHVVVTLADGTEHTAKVVGTDPASDLAVLHIEAKDLPSLPLGNSDNVRVGDVVLALGNPFGVGQTVTMGIISAKDRTTGVGNGSYEDFLQTDAPINQGNSGGALITTSGELIGINSQIISPGPGGFSSSGGNVGIGFAIPATMAKNVMNQLVTSGKVRRAILGITVQPMTSDLAKSLNLSGVRGALVNDVDASGPAAKAGVKSGDVILKVNGIAIDDSNQLRNRISSMAPGSTVTLDISRQGKDEQVSVKLGEPAASTVAEADHPATSSNFGMTVEPLTPALTRNLRVPGTTEGVAVTEVDPSGAAARAGIRDGDVIRQVDGRPVKTPAELREALGSGNNGRPALLHVQRADATFYVAVPRG